MANSSILNTESLNKRLNSYTNWKSSKCYVELAMAGFRYTGVGDRVQCDICGARVVQWTAADDALQCHARIAPSCKFLHGLGVTKIQNVAKYVKYATYSARLESMSGVDEQYVRNIPAVDKIAEAGFFHLGTLDRMACYHCGLILRDWETTTNPIEVHKQFRDNCHYIITFCDMKSDNSSQRTDALGVSATHRLVASVENHRAAKQSQESFTGRLGKMILEFQNHDICESDIQGNNETLRPENRAMRNSGPMSTIDIHESKEYIKPSKYNNGKCLLSTDGSGSSTSSPKLPVEPYIADQSQKTKATNSTKKPSITGMNPETQKATVLHDGSESYETNFQFGKRDNTKSFVDEVRHTGEAVNTGSRESDLISLQLQSSYSSGYHSELSELNPWDPRMKLPPRYSSMSMDFSELPMVKAVMEFDGVSYNRVVHAICARYQTHGDYFPDAEALLLGIIENESKYTER